MFANVPVVVQHMNVNFKLIHKHPSTVKWKISILLLEGANQTFQQLNFQMCGKSNSFEKKTYTKKQ